MMGDEVTALDFTTLVIAVAGLVAAVVSLGWQVVSWRWSGPRVHADIGLGIMTMTDGSLGPAVVTVEGINTGRAEASIVSWAIKFPDGGAIVPAISQARWSGPSLPVTLPGGHSAMWQVERSWLVEARREVGLGEIEVRAFIMLGSGTRLLSRNTIIV
jgi:hypothetical protein